MNTTTVNPYLDHARRIICLLQQAQDEWDALAGVLIPETWGDPVGERRVREALNAAQDTLWKYAQRFATLRGFTAETYAAQWRDGHRQDGTPTAELDGIAPAIPVSLTPMKAPRRTGGVS